MLTSRRMYNIVTHPKLNGSLLTIITEFLISKFFLPCCKKRPRTKTVNYPYDSRGFFLFMIARTNSFMVTSLYPNKYRLIFALALALQNVRIINDLLTHVQIQHSVCKFKRFYRQCTKSRIESIKCLLRHPRLNPHQQKARILKTMINTRNNEVVMLLLEDLFKRMNAIQKHKIQKLLGELVCLAIYCRMSHVAHILLGHQLVKTNFQLNVNKLYLKACATGQDAIAKVLYDDQRLERNVVNPHCEKMKHQFRVEQTKTELKSNSQHKSKRVKR